MVRVTTGTPTPAAQTPVGTPPPAAPAQPPTPATQTPPAETTAPSISPRDAARRRVESSVNGTARQGELQQGAGAPAQRAVTERDILSGARRSGLNATETTQLQNRLNGMNPQERRTEMRFLQSHVMNSPNADRGLRTYMELQNMRGSHPNRLSSDTVHTLTRGVTDRRAETRRGAEGIMGQDQAVRAARTLTQMPQSEFNRVQTMMDQAGQHNGRPVRGADPQAERALILESVAARSEALSHPSAQDRVRMAAGQPSSSMAEIEGYAGQIRGMRRNELIDQSTVLDIRDDNRLGALQQRFHMSCLPTSSQMVRAEADPIYARRLNQEALHTLNADTSSSPIAREQSALLRSQGGVPMPRTGTTIGGGLSYDGCRNILNNHASSQTGVNYHTRMVAGTDVARRAAVDRIEQDVRSGRDVPFVAAWSGGGAHAMVISDVRGSGDNRRFLVTDPADGRTSWVSARSMVQGNTTFIPSPPPSRGDISAYYD